MFFYNCIAKLQIQLSGIKKFIFCKYIGLMVLNCCSHPIVLKEEQDEGTAYTITIGNEIYLLRARDDPDVEAVLEAVGINKHIGVMSM